MNAGMKDIVNVMSKFLNLGMPLPEVILKSSWNPAREIRREKFGHLTVGAPADIAVLRLDRGDFGFRGHRQAADERLTAIGVRDDADVRQRDVESERARQRAVG